MTIARRVRREMAIGPHVLPVMAIGLSVRVPMAIARRVAASMALGAATVVERAGRVAIGSIARVPAGALIVVVRMAPGPTGVALATEMVAIVVPPSR